MFSQIPVQLIFNQELVELKQYIKKQYPQIGFTLAEVLITLLIIGIISSIVIPALVNETQDAELHTAWKKTYSDFDQAIKRIMMDNGGTMIDLCSTASDVNNCFRSKLLIYLNYIKDCQSGSSEGICWGTWGIDHGAFILSRGTLVKTELGCNNCNCNSWHGTLPKCAMIWVDVNGFKGPNLWGKDMYAVQVLANGIKPMGAAGDGYSTCLPSTSYPLGYACSAMYLYQ